MSAADMNRWQFGYAISNHTHTLQDHFALYIMFTHQSKDTETWHNYLQGNLSVKDPSVGRLLWDLPPSPPAPSGIRLVLRVDNHHWKQQIIKHPVAIYNHGSSSFLRSNNRPENDPFSHETMKPTFKGFDISGTGDSLILISPTS